ncbi:MAG TPA: hypothetical protein VGJ81_06530 [Thermoanaerobaculia bacterium]|jgi:hypothetical protein
MKMICFALVWLAGCLASLREGKTKTIGVVLVWLAGWTWALVAGIGGLALLIHEGPLPVTNGWFAMFSGIAACPLTATLLQKQPASPFRAGLSSRSRF